MTSLAKQSFNPAEERSVPQQEQGQYTLWQILVVWLAAGAPMWILGWLVYPYLSQNLNAVDAGLLRIKLFTVGLIWQFVLSMLIPYLEEGNIRLSTICRRFWLNNPVSVKTGQKDNRLWWWLIPLTLLVIVMELGLDPILNGIWTTVLPFLAEPHGYSPATYLPLNYGPCGSAPGTYSYCRSCSPYSTHSWAKNSSSAVCCCLR